MEKLEQLYEGKAKKVFATDDPELLHRRLQGRRHRLQRPEKGHHRGQGRHQQPGDQLPDEDAGEARHAHPLGRGALRPRDRGQKGYHRSAGGHRPQHRRRFPLQAAGACQEGTVLKSRCSSSATRTTRWAIRMVNDYHIYAMELATQEELDTITDYAFKINADAQRLSARTLNIELIDFKLEFGTHQRRHHHPGGRNFPRYLPLLGQPRPTKSWTRTASAGTWAAWRMPTRRSCTA